jgi:hypothetical protein
MAILVFGRMLESEDINRVISLLGGISVSGYVCSSVLTDPKTVDNFSLQNIQQVVGALFSQTTKRAVYYTLLETEVEETKTFPLYLVEPLRYLGLLNEDVANDHRLLDEVIRKHWDRSKINEVANNNFRYVKMPDGERIRDKRLAEVQDAELKAKATAKGCGPKCLSELAKQLEDEINSVQMIRRLSQ